ncbi:type II toxin-antitoxin system RelE/ParE family toxin [Oscillatoria amoena NRMC-F 0135]|uniref:Type II toxin-antitoxin system RelE/ParE family toxin n=1 Tax=Geitlerinema calcuttense NRMC-F 0142 TaxID=2922238 RepID=A0ABT7M336_9CYAN|nr:MULTISPECIES: type II toxin-antitoxin system RelE/ParE family toxin [Cyanophyceae]MDL5050387.1 type II toxin-antitoxin system RelE/ParE family toxin [Oscillatoria amoena NRMC-F 0135]MDL5054216.1 type II toxin-antitoxin system RelE/ParE family toxin [Oscillatoria laete-virens NRMC-F 0139]MDL5057466.1 type II toxin-antitoxin system RelE/ParE family toxin [Geitlerinema calcuttense NRMC-F 0142]
MNINFVPQARDEFLDAISYYEDAHAGLGYRFKDEVNRCVLWLSEHHELYRMRSGGYRRINLRIFPYYIPFVLRNDTLWVLAIAHCSRKPNYWITRDSKS